MNLTTQELEDIIRQHSDYNMPEPVWIDLPSGDVELSDEEKQEMSDYLNEYFEEHGADANDDFTSYQSGLMTVETAEKALAYASNKMGLDKIPDNVIDGCGSIETDGRENDPVTNELLHGYPIYADSIIDELKWLLESDSLTDDDWRFVHMSLNSHICIGHGTITLELIQSIVNKFHKKRKTMNVDTAEKLRLSGLLVFVLVFLIMTGMIFSALDKAAHPEPLKVIFEDKVESIATNLSGDFYNPSPGDTVAVQLTYLGEELIQIAIIGKWIEGESQANENLISPVNHRPLVNVIEKAIVK